VKKCLTDANFDGLVKLILEGPDFAAIRTPALEFHVKKQAFISLIERDTAFD